MIQYQEALNTILDNVQKMESEEKLLLEAQGQVLAEDIVAPCDLPRLATGIPDGYAVRSEDIQGASKEHPVTLRIIGAVRAGQVPRKAVKPRTAIRTMTGSVTPEGSDCIVRFESTDEPGDKNGPNLLYPTHVKVFAPVAAGSGITQPGTLIKKGALVVPKGTVIGPPQVSVITQLGRVKVEVVRRPIIAILSSGDELVKPGTPLSPGKIYDCNSGALATFVRYYGGIPKILGIARDNEASLVDKITRGMEADAIISSGGVSKGDYDLTRLIIARLGTLFFSRVNMAPGAAVAFGLLSKKSSGKLTPLFALSGPPMGSMVNFETLVRPALLKMLGREDVTHPSIEARATETIPEKNSMAFVKWTKVNKTEKGHQVAFAPGAKGILSTLAGANSLTIIPPQTAVDTENSIEVLPLNWS